MSELNVFAFVEAASFTKKDLMRGTDNDEAAEKIYVPFVVNRTFSLFPDTILYANEMNSRAAATNHAQFSFLLNTLRSRKRFSGKWSKPEEIENLDLVMEYFGYDRVRALEALRILTTEELAVITSKLEKGGIENGSRRRNAGGTSKDA